MSIQSFFAGLGLCVFVGLAAIAGYEIAQSVGWLPRKCVITEEASQIMESAGMMHNR